MNFILNIKLFLTMVSNLIEILNLGDFGYHYYIVLKGSIYTLCPDLSK